MARIITVASRLALGSLAIGFAAFLPAHFPGGLPRAALAADATFTVNSTGDEPDMSPGDGACAIAWDGPCTLRAAIQEANARVHLWFGADAIHFDLPPAGGYVISPHGGLPAIVHSLVIDGTTQPRYSGQRLVELDGRYGGQGNPGLSNTAETSCSATTSMIRGLAIHGFDDHGVVHGHDCGLTISRNSIYDNAGQGIFFKPRCDAVGPCGTGDHVPAVTSAQRVGDNIVVRGVSNANQNDFHRNPNVTLEFFANRSVDSSGYGEGEIFLGALTTHDYTFEGTFSAPPVGCIITMTGTTSYGDTSSFSRGVLIDAAPGVITVDSAADSEDVDLCADHCAPGGDGCTLRQAITRANATPATPTVAFDIKGPPTISLKAPLPSLIDPVVIDGTTQPGFSGKPLIELDGSLAGRTASGLDLRAGHSVVRGLVVNRFNVGIAIGSGNNTIQGNFIGTDPSGTIARGNRGAGVSAVFTGLWGSEYNNNLIGGTNPLDRNLISGNGGGVAAWSGTGVRLLGNFIGTDYSGTKSLANMGVGVSADGVTIGGPDPGEGNLISGNGGPGIALDGGALVVGNKIGTTANGKKPLGNAGAGIAGVIGESWVEARDNIIAYNGSNGIRGVWGLLQRNSIYSNGAEGLVMLTDYDYPTSSVVQSASLSRGKLTISGSARSVPDSNLDIEVFANEACDPSGFGEGELPLGSVRVTADAAGDASFSTTVDAPAGRFEYVTVTVTTIIDTYNRYTSSFSNCLPISRD